MWLGVTHFCYHMAKALQAALVTTFSLFCGTEVHGTLCVAFVHRRESVGQKRLTNRPKRGILPLTHMGGSEFAPRGRKRCEQFSQTSDARSSDPGVRLISPTRPGRAID
jgi:hypothetical protein